MRQPTQKQLDYAKRIADKYIARDGGRPAVEPRLQALALAEAWDAEYGPCDDAALRRGDIRHLFHCEEDSPFFRRVLLTVAPETEVNACFNKPRTLEEITAILEKAS